MFTFTTFFKGYLKVHNYFWKYKYSESNPIRHIQTLIRYMWRVANGLDNAALGLFLGTKPYSIWLVLS